MVYVGSSTAHWKTLQLSLLLHSKQSPNLKTNEHLLACFTKAQLDVLMSEQHPVVHWDIASVMSPRETLLTQPWLITHHLVSLQHYTTHHSFWSRAHLTASMSAPLISLLPLDGWMDTSRRIIQSLDDELDELEFYQSAIRPQKRSHPVSWCHPGGTSLINAWPHLLDQLVYVLALSLS